MTNSNLNFNLSSKEEVKQAVCYVIFTALCFSPLFGGEYFVPLYLIVFVDFLIKSRNQPRDELSKLCLLGFLISLAATLFYGVYHYDVISNGAGSAKYTFTGLGWFAFGFMLIDSARFQFSYYKLEQRVLSFILILTSFASIVYLIGGKVIEDPDVIQRTLTFTDRFVFWCNLNPNHVDNVILYVILMLIWSVSNYSKGKIAVLAIAFVSFVIMLIIFYISGSRGGILGAFVSAMFVGVVYFWRQNKKKHLLILAAVLVSIFIVALFNSSRLAQGINSISTLVTNAPSTQELFTNSSKELDGNRDAVLNILNNPSSIEGETIQVRVARICWPSGTIAEGNSFKGLDQNTVFRYLMFWEGIKLWSNKPYLGHGNYSPPDIISNYDRSEPCIIGYFSHLHNHYTHILIYFGAIGLFLFAILLVCLFYMFDKAIKTKGDRLLYIPVFYFVYLLVENNFDLTLDRNSELLSVLFCILLLFSI